MKRSLIISDYLSRVRCAARRMRKDTSGLAAVEFAMIVPLMLVMFFGTVEISSGVAADRKVSMIAQTLSDLTSRYTVVTSTDITNFFNIGNAMMTPYDATPLNTTISEILIDTTTGLGRVQWSVGEAVRGVATTMVVPSALISRDSSNNIVANQYLIFSEVSYLYTPAVGYVMGKAGVTLTDQTYTRPRQSTCVFYPSTPSNSQCPTS